MQSKIKLIILGIMQVVFFSLIAYVDDLREHVPDFLILYSLLFIVYFLAIKINKSNVTKIIVVFSILFHLSLLFTTPTLSDDIYRYMWDGKMQIEEINPFDYAPNDPILDQYKDSINPLINNPTISTIYPPIAQFFFYALTSISYTVLFYKLIFIIFNFATIYVILQIFKIKKINPRNLLIYAWNPLLIIETAGSGHYDSIAIFFLTLSWYLYEKRKEVTSIVSLSIATLSKFFAGLLFPLLFMRLKNKFLIIIAPILALLTYLPFIKSPNLFSGLSAYSNDFYFNGFIFELFRKLLFFTQDPNHIARILLAIIFMGIVGYISLKKINFTTSSIIILTSYFLLAPVLQPWYLLWLIPFLTIKPYKSVLYLTFAVGLSYYALIELVAIGTWHIPWWIFAIEFIPFYWFLWKEA